MRALCFRRLCGNAAGEDKSSGPKVIMSVGKGLLLMLPESQTHRLEF